MSKDQDWYYTCVQRADQIVTIKMNQARTKFWLVLGRLPNPEAMYVEIPKKIAIEIEKHYEPGRFATCECGHQVSQHVARGCIYQYNCDCKIVYKQD
jgi:hypothetical protein